MPGFFVVRVSGAALARRVHGARRQPPAAATSSASAQRESTGIGFAARIPLVVAELEPLLGFGSSVPGGGDTVAVLVNVVAPLTVPVIVITTLPPTGSTGTVPLTELPETLTAPQAAPPAAPPQLAHTPLTTAGTLSMNVVPSAGLGPALVISTV